LHKKECCIHKDSITGNVFRFAHSIYWPRVHPKEKTCDSNRARF